MKTQLMFTVLAFCLTIGLAYSKEGNAPSSENDGEMITAKKRFELKGPAAKNYHPAKYELEATTTITQDHAVKNLQGPKAKNYSPGDVKYAAVDFKEVSSSARTISTGLKAKR